MQQIKPYTEFISKIWQRMCSDLFEGEKNPYSVFAEGIAGSSYLSSQEYAVLRDEYARMLVSVIQENADVFGIEKDHYKLTYSLIFPDRAKVEHSCYPKNLRRWLNGGTVSRKKKCRIEFCVLVWCWCNGWGKQEKEDDKYVKLRNDIARICSEYVEREKNSMEAHPIEFSMELLWETFDLTYKMSCKI